MVLLPASNHWNKPVRYLKPAVFLPLIGIVIATGSVAQPSHDPKVQGPFDPTRTECFACREHSSAYCKVSILPFCP